MNRVRRKGKKSPNYPIIMLVAVFITGYGLFLTSNLWMPPSGNASMLTPLNTSQKSGSREVTMTRWVYSESQKMMECELVISNPSPDGVNTYPYRVVDRSFNELPVRTIVEEPDYVVLHIEDIPSRWSEVCLRMTIPSPEISHAGDEDVPDDLIRFYTNVKDVERVDTIREMSVDEYQLRRLDDEINIHESKINGLYTDISREEDNKSILRDEISRLKSEMEYQTEGEAAETAAKIKAAESQVSLCDNLIRKYTDQIEEARAKIDLCASKKEAYK